VFSASDADKRTLLKAMYDYTAHRVACGGSFDDELGRVIRNYRLFDAEDLKAIIESLKWGNGILANGFSLHKDRLTNGTQETHCG
jgi:hypothetical protein